MGTENKQRLLAVLFSGGKDSTYTVYEALKQGYNVRYLLVMESENPDSYMFHWPNIELAKLQAKLMDIKIVSVKTKGEKEKEVKDLEALIGSVKNKVGFIGAGALASRYQYERIEKICKKFNLNVFTPSWGSNSEVYWENLLKLGFRVIITKVSCGGLEREWLGREIDESALKKLRQLSRKYRFNLCGEGGEFETFVLDCPIFKKSIKIIEGAVKWFGDSGIYIIKKTEVVSK